MGGMPIADALHDAFHDALLDALAVVLPVACAGCGADDRALCPACRSVLVPSAITTTLGDGLEVASALRYEHVARRVILALKEQGRTDVAKPLAGALAAAITAATHGEVEIVTVPPSRSAYRRRGYDPVQLLLRRVGVPRIERVLERVRRTDRQKTLGREAREQNLVGSLRARHPLAGRRFLIVDDVLTTGATLEEAARAVRAGGGIVVSAATLAFTPKRAPIAVAADPSTWL